MGVDGVDSYVDVSDCRRLRSRRMRLSCRPLRLALVSGLALFAFALSSVPARAAAVTGTIAWGGTPTTFTVSNSGDYVSATIDNSTPGQMIYLDFSNTSFYYYNQLQLIAPDGVTVLDNTDVGATEIDRFVLSQAGNYTVDLWPGTGIGQQTPTGSVTFKLWADSPSDVNEGTIPLDGEIHQFNITTPGQYGYYTFSGTTGQYLFVSFQDTGSMYGYGKVALYLPDGTLWQSSQVIGGYFDRQPLPETGTYKLYYEPDMYVPANDTTGTKGFAADLAPPSSDDTGALQIGQSSTATIAQTEGGKRAWRVFYGFANQPVTVSWSGNGNYYDKVSIYKLNPDGTIASTVWGPNNLGGGGPSLTLPSTGPYLIYLNPDLSYYHWWSLSETFTVTSSWNVPLAQENGCDAAADGANDAAFFGDVNTLSGSYAASVSDISLPGYGVPLDFTRCYSSAFSGVNGPLGYGWKSSWGASLQFDQSGDALFTSESGQQISFTHHSDGSFSSSFALSTLTYLQNGTYQLARPDQVSYVFNSNGQPISELDRNGKGLSFSYNASSELTSVTDAAGRTATLSYNADGTISQVSFPDGREVSYGYTNGYLTSFTDVRGETWHYSYDSAGRLASIEDPNSNYPIRNTYNASTGQISSQEDANGNTRSFAYSASLINGTATTTMTDAAGGQWTDSYANNELVSRSDPLGDTSSFTYDAKGDKLTSTDPNGNTTTMTYDANGNLLTLASPPSLGYPAQQWTYDSKNDVLSHTDARNKTTSYGYDTAGDLTSITKPGGLTTTYNRDPSNPDLVDSTVDARGKTTSYSYNAYGEQTSVTDPDGNETSYTYNAAGDRITVTSPRGNVSGCGCASQYTTTTSYDNAGNKLSVTDPVGNETTYTYDPAGNLASMVSPRGNAAGANPSDYTTSYGYDAANEQTSVTRPGNVVTSTTYNSRGLVTSTTSPLGRKTTYAYDAAGRLTSLVSPNGNVSGCGCAAQYTTSYAYDADGNRVKVTNPLGGVTTTSYDPLGRVTQTAVWQQGANPGPPQLTTYGYDGDGNLVFRADPMGRRTTATYDANNLLTSSTVAGTAAYAQSVQADGASAYWRVDERSGSTATNIGSDGSSENGSYSSATLGQPGALSSSGDSDPALGSGTLSAPLYALPSSPSGTLTVSFEGWFERTAQPASYRALFENGDGNASTGGYGLWAWTTESGCTSATVGNYMVGLAVSGASNCALQAPVSLNAWHYIVLTHSGLGTSGTWSLYVDGSLSASVTSSGASTGAIQHVPSSGSLFVDANQGTIDEPAFYKSVALSAAQVSAHYAAVTQVPVGRTTSYVYDNDGNLTSTTDPKSGVTSYSYDDAGLLQSSVSPLGNVAGCNCAAQYTTSYGYDADGNQTSVTDPLGDTATTSFNADGQPVSTTDPMLRQTQYQYDADGNLTKTIAADNSSVSYAYNALDQLTSVTDGNNHTTSYTPDAEGELTQVVNPLGNTTTYAYDANGNQTQTIDAIANAAQNPSLGTTSVTYNALNEPAQVSYSDGTPTASYGYDVQGNLISRSDASGTTNYSLNPDNQPTAATTGSSGFSYGYDAYGELNAETYPNGTQVSYGYDANGNLTSVNSGSRTIGYGYDANNQLTSQTLPAGSAALTYDNAGRLATLTNTSNGQTLSSYSVTRDKAGEPTQLAATNNGSSWTESYTYDPVGRLASVCYTGDCSVGTSWTYDAAGNRTSQTVTGWGTPGTTTYQYNNANELESATLGQNTTNYSYNADGEQTAAGSSSYSWNLAGELISATVGGQTTNYTYDGAGMRVSATNGANTINYSWNEAAGGLPTLAAETNGSGGALRTYLYGPSSSPASMITSSGSYYYAYDAYGNVSDLTDANGATQWAYQYDPFGVVRSAVNVSGAAPTNPFQYAGQYTDAGVGLSDMRARQYDPTTGSFLTIDPLGQTTTLASSPYAYAGDLPILYSDPSGLCLDGLFGSGSCPSEASSFVSDASNTVKDVYNGFVKPIVKAAYNHVIKPLIVDPIKQTVQADWSCITGGHNCASAVVQTALWALPVDGLLGRDLAFAGGDAIRAAIRDAGKDIGDRVSSGAYRLATEEKGSIDLLAGGGGGAGANDTLAKTAADSLNAADDSAAATTGSSFSAAAEESAGDFIHVDVGGEGKYPGAINVNPASEGTYGPIPNRVPGTAQSNPLPDEFADLVTAENIPLHQAGAVEGVARLVKPGGTVSVVNPAAFAPTTAAHQTLIALLGGQASQVVEDGLLTTTIRAAR